MWEMMIMYGKKEEFLEHSTGLALKMWGWSLLLFNTYRTTKSRNFHQIVQG